MTPSRRVDAEDIMSSLAEMDVMGLSRKMPFCALVQQVFSLDSAIQWVALEEAGREPRWAWRDPETGELCAGTTMENVLLIDPLMLMLAEGPEAMIGDREGADLHQLRFIVLHYADLVQIVAHFGRYAHIGVAIAPGADPCVLGTKVSV